MDNPTRVPDTASCAYYLNLFLTSHPDKCTLTVLSSCRILDPSLFNVYIEAKPKAFLDVQFHRKIYWYTKTDLDSFRSYISEAL